MYTLARVSEIHKFSIEVITSFKKMIKTVEFYVVKNISSYRRYSRQDNFP